MATWIALLRGVNLGGANRVKMADVRAVFEAQGWTQVRSLGQSGNLVFETAGTSGGAALEASAETALQDKLGLRTLVVIRTPEAWQAMIAANPFPGEASADPERMVAVALKGAANADAETALAALASRERVHVTDQTAYIVYPDGQADSRLAGGALDRALGTKGTGRNWNTVLRIAQAGGRRP